MLQKKNFAKSLTTNNPLAIGGTSLGVTTGEGVKFPAVGATYLFMGVIWGASFASPEADPDREVVEAYQASTDTFTIVRARESSTAKAWPVGSNFMLAATSYVFSEIELALNFTYQRDVRISAKTVSVAADRYTILSPNKMLVSINAVQYYLPVQIALDLSVSATWDSIATDYRTAANRIGKNFYIYACVPVSGLAPAIIISANNSAPTGYNTTTSLKIGGFHCLGIAVGTISGHTLTGYVAGDILPQSVWDLKFKPQSAPEGMVYDSGSGKWVDIYLASVSSGELASIYGATIADGTSSPAFHWYKFAQWFSRLKKKLPDQTEFMSLSMGANQSTNITGSADPGTTGGHTDTAGRRMISNIGCEDSCGVLWQWGRDRGGGQTAEAWANAYDGNDAGVGGQHYLAPNAVLFGGDSAAGVVCGSRGAYWSVSPMYLAASLGARGVSEPVVGF